MLAEEAGEVGVRDKSREELEKVDDDNKDDSASQGAFKMHFNLFFSFFFY